jgi:hypothetical protein
MATTNKKREPNRRGKNKKQKTKTKTRRRRRRRRRKLVKIRKVKREQGWRRSSSTISSSPSCSFVPWLIFSGV